MEHSPAPAVVSVHEADIDGPDAPESTPGRAVSGMLDLGVPGDAIVVLALVPAPTLRRAVSPEADMVLHDSLRRIVDEAVPAGARIVPWTHGQLLVVLPRTTRAEAVAVMGEVRRRWHCSWTAPVAVASGASAVDETTSPETAVMLAGAEVSAAKERVAHT